MLSWAFAVYLSRTPNLWPLPTNQDSQLLSAGLWPYLACLALLAILSLPDHWIFYSGDMILLSVTGLPVRAFGLSLLRSTYTLSHWLVEWEGASLIYFWGLHCAQVIGNTQIYVSHLPCGTAGKVKRKEPFRSFHWVLRNKGADENPKSLGFLCPTENRCLSSPGFILEPSWKCRVPIWLWILHCFSFQCGRRVEHCNSAPSLLLSLDVGTIHFVSNWHYYGWWDYKIMVPMLNPTAAFLVALVLRLLFPAVKPKEGQ